MKEEKDKMGLKKLFGGFGKEKRYMDMTCDELSALDDSDLRDAVQARMMSEAGRHEVKQCLEMFSGAKKTFYVASLYEAEVSTGGLARFLLGPGRSAADSILGALKAIHAARHAKLLEKFVSDNGIDLYDLNDLRIESTWDYDEQKSRYPFEEFDEKFRKLYEKESIDERLVQYVRNHIDRF